MAARKGIFFYLSFLSVFMIGLTAPAQASNCNNLLSAEQKLTGTFSDIVWRGKQSTDTINAWKEVFFNSNPPPKAYKPSPFFYIHLMDNFREFADSEGYVVHNQLIMDLSESTGLSYETIRKDFAAAVIQGYVVILKTGVGPSNKKVSLTPKAFEKLEELYQLITY